ncbi:MAG TPA: hypothetical protein VLJ60_12385 [bacterium]|nr:hypothetical protein [bacterium]
MFKSYRFLIAAIFFLSIFSCSIKDDKDQSVADEDVTDETINDSIDSESEEDGSENDLSAGDDTEENDDAEEEHDEDVFCGSGDGIYSVYGIDDFGSYTGTVQLFEGSLIRLIEYSEYGFEEKKAALALTGSGAGQINSVSVSFVLQPIGFIKNVEDETRDGIDASPVTFSGELDLVECGVFKGIISGKSGDTDYVLSETWTWISETDGVPLWINERVEIPNGPEPDEATKNTIKQTFSSFHELPDVSVYAEREEFNNFVHLMVFDPTDYEFYQQNQDIIRVIQKIPDKISLAEAWMRNNAYRFSMKEKEEIFHDEIADLMINELGMVSHKKGDEYEQDGDSLLWTGVYVAALSMKYLITQDNGTLDKMLKSLNGMIACLDITPDPAADFARTLRLKKEDGDPEFHLGTGTKTVNGYQYNQIEYKENGNNDMAKGPMIAYLWAYQVLKDKAEYKQLMTDMTESLKRMRENHPVFKDTKTNQALTNLILAALMSSLGTGYIDDKLKYETEGRAMFTVVKEYFDSDFVVTNQYGVSDWSGNHLTIWTIQNFLTAYALLNDTEKLNYMKGVMNKTGNDLKYNRTGLFQLMTGAAGAPSDNDSVEDAKWRMREIPVDRARFYVDWEINPQYCVSPIPELFWKNDWTTSNRKQSIRAYPVFEKSGTNYFWKDNILNGNRGGGGEKGVSALDFYIAYWYGRFMNVIVDSE